MESTEVGLPPCLSIYMPATEAYPTSIQGGLTAPADKKRVAIDV